jgi:hypothetical protein
MAGPRCAGGFLQVGLEQSVEGQISVPSFVSMLLPTNDARTCVGEVTSGGGLINVVIKERNVT